MMTLLRVSTLLLVLTSVCGVAHGQLWVDFNSTTQDNGPHPHPAYQAYDAGHEVPEDFVTAEFDAFGGTVSFTPSWPDSTDANTMQMIDRGTQEGFDEDDYPIVSSHDANWLEGDDQLLKDTGSLDLLTDWIGVDTRTGNGGNGDYDGDLGDPTRILFTLGGIPAGEYSWTSFHHDTENIHTAFMMDISLDGGATFATAGDGEFAMTSSAMNGNPAADVIYDGLDEDFEPIPLTDLPSTVQFNFNASGDDVVLQFTPLSEVAVHRQIMGVNGFQLEQLSIAEPAGCVIPDGGIGGDLNGDGAVGFPDFLLLSANFGGTDLSYEEGDINCDGSVGFPDFLVLSANFGQTAAAVPEPTGLALLSVAGLLLGCVRRRR